MLAEDEFFRVGGRELIRVDVRVIAATNQHLPRPVADGRFRADLLDRLAFEVLTLPPLRARPEDIPLLATHFAREMAKELDWPQFPGFAAAAMDRLLAHAWPGNVRELEHVISRAALKALSRGGERGDIVTLDAALLDLDVGREVGEAPVANGRAAGPGFGALSGEGIPTGEPDADWPSGEPIQLRDAVDACQRRMIRQALAACDGNWSQAARRLDVDASNLHKLARRLGLK